MRTTIAIFAVVLAAATEATPGASNAAARVLKDELVRCRFDRFNLDDEEIYTNAIPNKSALSLIGREIPLFECPDEDIERTYYFRWWTYRKHLRRTKDGRWVVTEFLPNVSWAGADNTIACPFGHHVREGRWLRNRAFLNALERAKVMSVLFKRWDGGSKMILV